MITKVKQHCYVVTGGPGMGKTTLINGLREAGYHTIQESGRRLIQEEVALSGKALPGGSLQSFAMAMWDTDLKIYNEISEGQLRFFDRGFPDAIGFMRLCNLKVPPALFQTAMDNRYNQQVFIAPPWEAIYQQDNERMHSFDEAVDTYHHLKLLYEELKYEVIVLPLTSVAGRVKFILDRIS